MRTSVTLDDDAYELAVLYSKGRGITLGAAISELVRKGIEADRTGTSSRLKKASNGLLIYASQGNGRAITNEMVKKALEEDD